MGGGNKRRLICFLGCDEFGNAIPLFVAHLRGRDMPRGYAWVCKQYREFGFKLPHTVLLGDDGALSQAVSAEFGLSLDRFKAAVTRPDEEVVSEERGEGIRLSLSLVGKRIRKILGTGKSRGVEISRRYIKCCLCKKRANFEKGIKALAGSAEDDRGASAVRRYYKFRRRHALCYVEDVRMQALVENLER